MEKVRDLSNWTPPAGKMPGPCKRCGRRNYGLSTSGPDYCGACACGVPVETIRLRDELSAALTRNTDYMLALSVATGRTTGFTDKMIEIGTANLARFKKGEPMKPTFEPER